MSFATFDPTRKGSGVTLLDGNLEAVISGLYMVAATDPQTIGSGLYYAEFINNSSDFYGIGLSRSDTATDTYQGAYEGQCTVWQDSSTDNGGGMDVSPNRPEYAGLAGIKILVTDVGLMIGELGGGWWSTITEDWTGDPSNNDICIIRSIAAGLYSLGITSISDADITANFGQSAWIDTPPLGAVGWPGSGGSDVTVDLTGAEASSAIGSVGVQIAPDLSGTQTVSAAGNLTISLHAAISGEQGAAATGSVGANVAPVLGGVEASAALGNLSANDAVRIALDGIAATTALGTFGALLIARITGVQATAATGSFQFESTALPVLRATAIERAGVAGRSVINRNGQLASAALHVINSKCQSVAIEDLN